MTPDGKTFDPETVTDKQLVQYEQAIDRGLTEAEVHRSADDGHRENRHQGRRLRTLPRPADGRTAHGSRLSGRGARWERLACGTSLPLPHSRCQ